MATGKEDYVSRHDDDNRSNQLNPNNDEYWSSRGWDERPDDWQERVEQDNAQPESSCSSASQKNK